MNFVYFVQADNGQIKIGVTNNVRRRISALQTGSSEGLKLIGFTEGDAELEKKIHAHLAAFRTRGEWFMDHPAVVAHINSFPKVAENLLTMPLKERPSKCPLHAWRKQNGFTLDALSTKLGVVKGFICDIENGRSRPGWAFMEAIYELSGGQITPNDFAHWMLPAKAEAA